MGRRKQKSHLVENHRKKRGSHRGLEVGNLRMISHSIPELEVEDSQALLSFLFGLSDSLEIDPNE